jgi:hypothetical protein
METPLLDLVDSSFEHVVHSYDLHKFQLINMK